MICVVIVFAFVSLVLGPWYFYVCMPVQIKYVGTRLAWQPQAEPHLQKVIISDLFFCFPLISVRWLEGRPSLRLPELLPLQVELTLTVSQLSQLVPITAGRGCSRQRRKDGVVVDDIGVCILVMVVVHHIYAASNTSIINVILLGSIFNRLFNLRIDMYCPR